MIRQLVHRLRAGVGGPALASHEAAVLDVLSCDVLDLILHLDQVWRAGTPGPGVAGAREALVSLGRYRDYVPGDHPAWDHLGYSFVLENSRAVQILRRVVCEYRAGERLGAPSAATERWLDTTEALLLGAVSPLAPWLAGSAIGPDAEAVRRNAYWRLFGMDLAFGDEDNRSPVYERPTEANTGFVTLFETLLFELSQVIDMSGVNASSDDRVFRLAQALHDMLLSRRRSNTLSREELSAATALGWAELTLASNTPVVADLRAEAGSPAERLCLIGERVGLPAHRQSSALFSMSSELSLFLRTVESGVVASPAFARLLYLEPSPAEALSGRPQPVGPATRKVITQWAAATGRDLRPAPS